MRPWLQDGGRLKSFTCQRGDGLKVFRAFWNGLRLKGFPSNIKSRAILDPYLAGLYTRELRPVSVVIRW